MPVDTWERLFCKVTKKKSQGRTVWIDSKDTRFCRDIRTTRCKKQQKVCHEKVFSHTSSEKPLRGTSQSATLVLADELGDLFFQIDPQATAFYSFGEAYRAWRDQPIDWSGPTPATCLGLRWAKVECCRRRVYIAYSYAHSATRFPSFSDTGRNPRQTSCPLTSRRRAQACSTMLAPGLVDFRPGFTPAATRRPGTFCGLAFNKKEKNFLGASLGIRPPKMPWRV